MRHYLVCTVRVAGCLAAASLGFWPAQVHGRSDAGLVRLEEILWREVRNLQGEALGGISDVLVQMPSGRIVFIAVDPAELFQRPKAVPPGAVRFPSNRGEPLLLDITKDRWTNAPRLDWDAALVIEKTAEGGKVYGYYQQAWREPDPTPSWGMHVVARPPGTAPAPRYVSLKNLLLERVETNGRQHAGYIHDFLIDWTARRATHALVSSRLTPPVKRDAMWFVVPARLLSPPVESDAIVINSSSNAFRGAPPWPEGGAVRSANAATIYRYPAPRQNPGG